MLGDLFNNPFEFLLWITGLIVAITIHECSHAIVADRLGDPTPRLAGRITLNPLAHLDVLGTLMLLIARFGWGKPVQIDVFNLRHPRRDTALISLAGPASNIGTAILLTLIMRLLIFFFPASAIISLLLFFFSPLIIMSVSLAIFNLIPIHPFDGFAIVRGILPEGAAKQWQQLEGLGIIMIFVLVLPVFGSSPVLSFVNTVINSIINVLLP